MTKVTFERPHASRIIAGGDVMNPATEPHHARAAKHSVGWRGAAARIVGSTLLASILVLGGCAAGPNYHTPKPDTPPRFAVSFLPVGSPAPADEQELATWWRALGDSELDSLVDRAIRSNLDIEIALTRLQQARTYESVVMSVALPQINASAAAARGTGSDLGRARADQALVSATNTAGLTQINTLEGFDAIWELDLFGKFRREIEATKYDAQAAAAARYGVITTVIADVVRGYIDLRGFQVQAGVLRQAVDVLRESLRLESIRYQRGIINELDEALASRELSTVEAQLAPMMAQEKAAQYALAVLVGEYPENMVQELSRPDLVPSMPAAASAGTPLELLKRRPDVQEAERQLASATARIGVATANLYPQVGLVGSIGAQGQGWGTSPAIGSHIWSFGPAALWPVLDFGALDAQVDVARLGRRAYLLNYRRAILNAVQQVDTALDAYSAQQDRLKNLGDGLLAAQRAVDLATARYNRGMTDYLNVVDAERQLYDIQEEYAQAQVAEGEQFVQLYKSLGGGWENYQSVPAIQRPLPAIIAAFRRAVTSSAP
ncbi:MAG: efflux transporter outer membrane subunit [Steroidobacteraceae bacterium]